mmetsp:Transcript_88671/g.251388  ORF Transcript_88671/g.251388 Transcript_88671/m.251388 type:complete len:294 (+) Transcript_88671:29-910(+)
MCVRWAVRYGTGKRGELAGGSPVPPLPGSRSASVPEEPLDPVLDHLVEKHGAGLVQRERPRRYADADQGDEVGQLPEHVAQLRPGSLGLLPQALALCLELPHHRGQLADPVVDAADAVHDGETVLRFGLALHRPEDSRELVDVDLPRACVEDRPNFRRLAGVDLQDLELLHHPLVVVHSVVILLLGQRAAPVLVNLDEDVLQVLDLGVVCFALLHGPELVILTCARKGIVDDDSCDQVEEHHVHDHDVEDEHEDDAGRGLLHQRPRDLRPAIEEHDLQQRDERLRHVPEVLLR